jgi:hypothetical protein
MLYKLKRNNGVDVMKTANIQDLARLKQDLYNTEVIAATEVQQKKLDTINFMIEPVGSKILHKNSRRRWTNSERRVIH